jgi:hypothetical protein
MYTPSPGIDFARSSEDEIIRYFTEELEKISRAFQKIESGTFLPVLHNEPTKKRLSQLVFADGADWDPGSGAGYYFWSGAAWVPLHT